jgi:hypothetical protein
MPKETIKRHRAYCEKTEAFNPGGTNEIVQKRLEHVLSYYKPGASWMALAKAAAKAIPMPKEKGLHAEAGRSTLQCALF